MIKASKVVFISDQLEDDFKSLTVDDPIKKGMTRAITDLKENAFSGTRNKPKILFLCRNEMVFSFLAFRFQRDYSLRNISGSMA